MCGGCSYKYYNWMSEKEKKNYYLILVGILLHIYLFLSELIW